MSSIQAGKASSALADRYRVLLDISRTLSGTLSSEELYDAVFRETAEVLEFSRFHVVLYDQATDTATVAFHAAHGAPRAIGGRYRGSASEVLRTGQAALSDDPASFDPVLELDDGGPEEPPRSTISAPLRHHDRVLGLIAVHSNQASAYDEDDLELLQGIADIAAVAMENAHFVSELEHRRREAEQVEEIGRALTSSLDTQEVLGKITSAVLRVMGVDGSAVWLLDGSRARVARSAGDVRVPEGTEWEVDGPIRDRLAGGRSVVIHDLAGSDWIPEELRPHLRDGSGVAVPLETEGELVGALSAGSRTVRAFTEEDLRVLRRIANQASVALANARLHQDLQALSMTDPLTGLPNRRALEIHLQREVAAARRGRELVLVMMDLDRFKAYNDRAGHLAGDDALQAFAGLLASENRAMNLVARYGGDEFVSVLSDSDLEGAAGYIRRIQYLVREEPVLADNGISVSAGAACFDAVEMEGLEQLIAAADAELYREKADRTP